MRRYRDAAAAAAAASAAAAAAATAAAAACGRCVGCFSASSLLQARLHLFSHAEKRFLPQLKEEKAR